MKILFYNWVPFDDAKHRGGGVTVYLKNLLEQMIQVPENQCYFISSGTEYTLDGKLRIIQTQNCYEEKVKSFQIINSPVHAPAVLQFRNLHTYLNDVSLLELLERFWKEQGGFDVVHFHNLEGLSIQVLKLKEWHSGAKFVFSIHNYFLFCPQVNLWNSYNENCFCCSQFPQCSSCVTAPTGKTEGLISATKVALGKIIDFRDSPMFPLIKKAANYVRKKSAKHTLYSDIDDVLVYEKYREQNIAFANLYFDKILAVSHRVAEIAQSYGILESKLFVEYIGTSAADHALPPKQYLAKDPICIGFLGYARIDKGFDFFLDIIKALPLETARNMQLLLAAKCETPEIFNAYQRRIADFSERFLSVEFQNGFSKEEQDQLLNRIDLGIVPVLWEDNLPQIAIEYVAHGIPILVSDAGGAQELCTDKFFVFQNNDVFDAATRLDRICKNTQQLSSFWESFPKMTTLRDHIKQLMMHYSTQ